LNFTSIVYEVEGLEPSTSKIYAGDVRSLFTKIGFAVRKLNYPVLQERRVSAKFEVDNETIYKLMNAFGDVRDKLIILIKFQSGLDNSTLLDIRLRNLLPLRCDYEAMKGNVVETTEQIETPIVIWAKRHKTGTPFKTAIGEDAKQLLITYLKERQRRYEKLTWNSYLIAAWKPLGGKLKPQTIDTAILNREAYINAGLITKEEMDIYTFNPLSPHAFRAAFKSILKSKGVNDDIVDYMAGHKTKHRGAYDLYSDENIRKAWLKAEDEFTVLGEAKVKK